MAPKRDSARVRAPQQCLQCKGSFTRTANRQTFCTPDCRRRWQNGRRREKFHQAPPRRVLICTKCGVTVPRGSRRKTYCADCAQVAKTEYSRNYAAEHRQESTEKVQRSYRKHRAAVIARKAARRATPAGKAETAAYNRSPERRERLKEWDRQKRAADPAYVLGKRISHGIRLAIKAGKAGRRWETLVGYTLADLSAHIERQFLPGMTWANMGDWHIDHIVPQAAFSFATADDPEFRACWALTNLRPLWALDNLKKRATRPLLL